VIIDVDTGETRNVDHGQKQTTTQTTEVPKHEPTESSTPETQTTRAQTDRTAQPHDRDVQLFQLQWSDDGKNAVLLARSADNKDRWVLILDPKTGKTKVLSSLHDDAWIGGPGSFTLGSLPDNKHIYFESERDGYAHLYLLSIDGGEPTQLTSGQFEVSDVRLSRDKSKFYFTSSEGSPFEKHLYSMSTSGGVRIRITTLPGNNDVDISPDETTLADIRSYSNKPPELYLLPNEPAQKSSESKPVTTSPIPEFFTYDWTDPRIVNFKARDGATSMVGSISQRLKPGGPAVSSFMVQATYKTYIDGGVRTIESTCSIICSWNVASWSWISTTVEVRDMDETGVRVSTGTWEARI
jgi:dipeptidyl aminopeptidase/acylaminoacyl peptidase